MLKPKKPFLKLVTSNSSTYYYLYLMGELGLSLCVILLLIGCRSDSMTKPSPPVQPTTTSTASTTQNPHPLLIIATQSTPIAEQKQPVDLKTSLYSHPEDLFSLQVPENLSITQNHDSATFTDTKGELTVHVDIVNTGYLLDAETFANFYKTVEIEKASEFENYVEVDRQQVPGSNSILITKQFSYQDYWKTLATLYQQQGKAILILDFIIEQDLFESYKDLFNTITNSVKVNPDAISNLPIYAFDRVKMHSNGFFSILTPPYWSLKHSMGENSIVETFTSPDEQAIIQTIVYDDEQPLSKNVAGKLVLTLLGENYTKGIIIETDVMLADGREKITWRSSTADYRGITVFETRGSALFGITVMWSHDPDQYYQNILEDIIDSYSVIVPGEG